MYLELINTCGWAYFPRIGLLNVVGEGLQDGTLRHLK